MRFTILITLAVTLIATIVFKKNLFDQSVANQQSQEDKSLNSIREADAKHISLEGKSLAMFITAHTALLEDKEIASKFKLLKNYNVLIYKDDNEKIFRIHFAPKRSPGDEGKAGGETKLGIEVSYFIRASDQKIIKRFFYK